VSDDAFAAIALFKEGHEDEGRRRLRALVDADPSDVFARAFLAEALLGSAPDAARAEIDHAVADDPGDPNLRLMAAAITFELGDTPAAREHLRAFGPHVSADTLPAVTHLAARIHLAEGDRGKARAVVEAALLGAPDDEELLALRRLVDDER
jgi:predicted Zn-dependent protease